MTTRRIMLITCLAMLPGALTYTWLFGAGVLLNLLCTDTQLHRNTGITQGAEALARNDWVGVLNGDHRALDTRLNQRLYAGACPPFVAAWLKRHVGGRAGYALRAVRVPR